MIISASRRTDIPCYYSDWLINRLQQGFVFVKNPMNHSQLKKVNLSPDVVDCIVFWTKDPENIIGKLPLIDKMGYKYYFQFTLTPYENDIERGLRSKEQIESTFLKLSNQIGKEKVIWRYDPIVLNEQIDINFHTSEFERLCEKFHNHCETVIISFVDIYAKLKTPLLREITTEEMNLIGKSFCKIANRYNIKIKSCCEEVDLTQYGITKSGCIDKQLIERICDCPMDLSQDYNQRKECTCAQSIDIGAYDTCQNGCIYCYANRNYNLTITNVKKHNPNNPILLGDVSQNEKFTEKVQLSNKTGQLRF